MPTRAVSILWMLVVAGLAGAAVPGVTGATQSPPSLAVHEWGTFTTIAGPDGQAMQWLPLGGPADLPCFVRRDGV